MNFVALDLEWNGAYVKKLHGYFNEIIEIGAVKLDSQLCETDRFHTMIRPVVSKKLTKLVTGLTNITDEELTDGGTFTAAMSALRKFIGKEDAVLLTWSTTDLLVLLENYRYFCKTETIPFMQAYVDLQAYYQHRQDMPTSHQVGLTAACEQLAIGDDGVAHHRALGDSILTARILQQVYEPDSFAAIIRPADASFYARITFKNTYITDIHDPLVRREHKRSFCPDCGQPLKRQERWRAHNHMLCAEMICTRCKQRFISKIQIKQKYDAVEVKRKLVKKSEESQNEPERESVHA